MDGHVGNDFVRAQTHSLVPNSDVGDLDSVTRDTRLAATCTRGAHNPVPDPGRIGCVRCIRQCRAGSQIT